MIDTSYIEDYRRFLSDIRKASENTISSYIRDITKFSAFIETGRDRDFPNVKEDDIKLFISSLEEKRRSPATITRYIASLKSFYGCLLDGGVIGYNPTSNISAAALGKELPNVLTGEEVNRLLEQPNATCKKGCRDRAMLETLYATGLRVSELLALDDTDINLDTGLVSCRSNKERSIPVYTAAALAIEKYLTDARPVMAEPGEHALFVNTAGKRMSRQGFWKLLKGYAKTAQIDTDITPQMLRNSFAAHLIENGVDMHVLQEMLGHADISSTQVYARVVKKQLKDVYNRAHPRA